MLDIKKYSKPGRYFGLFLGIGMALTASAPVKAQLSELGNMYFTNQYFANPAMAGLTEGLNLNLAYRRQFTEIAQTPNLSSLTAEYGLGEKMGVGLNVYTDQVGVFRSTRAMVSYAYHLPLNANDAKLNFGISAGLMSERLSTGDMVGGANDPSVAAFNDRGNYFDGDLGISYTDGKLTLQASAPNFMGFFRDYTMEGLSNRGMIFAAASYKSKLNLDGVNPLGIEPKFVYRKIAGYEALFDAGANLTFLQEKLSIMGLYHSDLSFTAGAGVRIKDALGITGMYRSATGDPQNFSYSKFEIGLQLKLSRN
ncbi:PorP/SprF family type IX secretion system membrane protein [Pedobacter sp. SYP-B3415]|uniref:PorP/SprF family type IX secretion system membrane protein n=1 Tax=Pedobacter sp. SYP-B3415 TaxID=2496641 RepID=UPI00101CEE99|nr:PorP/SprF family type IX secretion system membrane protein [Pedobacter sp. SYP-B3415]